MRRKSANVFLSCYLQIDVSKIVRGFVEKLSIEPTSLNLYSDV